MSARLLGLALAPLFATATAYAQAPGEMTPESAPPGEVTPTYVAPRPTLMSHRWAIGLNLGAFSVAPQDAPDDSATTDFRTSELSVRFRLAPNWELELLLAGGRQVLEDDSDGDLAMGGGTLGVRYRFRPQQSWNWWVMGGLGGTVIANHESTREERDAAMRPHVALGIGLEKRFNRFALQAEFRGMGLGPTKAQQDMTDAPPKPATDSGMPLPPDSTADATSNDLSGGTFTIGASFYF